MGDANSVPLSPLSFLNRSADVFGGEVGVVTDAGTPVTWSTLRRRAAQLADRVQAEGVASGGRVGVLAPNDLPLLEAHYGVPAAGAALVALNTRLAPREYAHILNHARVELLIVDAGLRERISEVEDQLTSVRRIIDVTDDGDGYEAWLSKSSADGPLPLPDDENRPITINYTSGTTGLPKGAVYTHRGAYLNAMGQAMGLQLSPRSVYLWTLPMFHCNGWCYTWAVTAASARHICQRRFEPARALDLIEQHGVTHFCGAPVVLNSMAYDPSAAGRTFEQRVVVATGGAPPAPAVISRMAALGIEVVHLYGLTETYGPSLVCEPQPSWDGLAEADLAERVSRQGVRTLNVEGARVVDANLEDVPADGRTMGEIVIRSNSVMQGYLDDEAATAEAFRGGWFHTGDLAVRHPDGYIEVRDRSKDIIISGGENISSIEVENVLAAHPAVLEVGVVAAPDERWGEVPVAFVTPKDDAEISAEELIGWVRERLAHFKAPREVRFQPLPKTSTGKIQKTELRKLVGSPVGGTTDDAAVR